MGGNGGNPEGVGSGPEPGSPSTSGRLKVRRTRKRSSRRRTIALRVTVLLLALLAVVGVASAWLVHKATEVRAELGAATSLAPQFRDQLASRDNAGAGNTLEQLKTHTAAARQAATDPLWKAAGSFPVLGANFAAITEIAVSADDLVNRAAEPMLRASQSVEWESLVPSEGRVDIAPLETASPVIVSAANTVELSYQRLAGIDRGHLFPQVSNPLDEATDTLERLRTTMNSAAAASKIVPAMLGSETPRNYLVLVQNNAEVRATGGLPGALAVLHAENGAVSLTAQASGSSLGAFQPPVETDPEQERIYTDRLGLYISDVNLTPHFPTAAATAKTMWEMRNDTTIDGVFALDPVVLSHILGASGPVPAPDISGLPGANGSLPKELTAENVVRTLMSEVYLTIGENTSQDDYFTAVSRQIFTTVTSGNVRGDKLIQALRTSWDEGRLYLWSSHEDEQKVLATLALGGAVSGPSVGGAAFGAYFNDGTGAKMDYYVQRTVQLVQACHSKGLPTFTLKVTLTNTAPEDAATSLPTFVTGGGKFGTEPGRVQTNTVVYGPTQARIENARIDGESVPLGSYQHNQRPVGVLTSKLGPGESATMEFDFANVVQKSEPTLDVTPTAQSKQEVIQPLVRQGC